LTGLPNRQLFFDRLAQAMHSARAERRQLAVMIIDVQRFKRINDTLGRYAGDQILKELAGRLQRTSASPQFRRASAAIASPWCCPMSREPPWRAGSTTGVIDSFAEPLIIDEIELRTTVKVELPCIPRMRTRRRACS